LTTEFPYINVLEIITRLRGCENVRTHVNLIKIKKIKTVLYYEYPFVFNKKGFCVLSNVRDLKFVLWNRNSIKRILRNASDSVVSAMIFFITTTINPALSYEYNTNIMVFFYELYTKKPI